MKQILIISALIFLTACGKVTPKIDQGTGEAKRQEIELNEVNLTDSTVNFLWRDLKYDSIQNQTSSSIFLNEEYIKSMTPQEKVAIGYVATFIGNQCRWDGKANEDRSNLECKIISALGLGYQCSENHLGFLRKWFATDEQVLSELEACPTIPNTATVQNTFDEIVIATKGNSISVYFKASGVNLREEESWNWSETVYFSATTDNLNLVKKDRSDLVVESLK